MKKKIKKYLIIDAANEKIIFKIIDESKIYTNDYENSRKNFDKFAVLLFNFLNKKTMSFDIIDKVSVGHMSAFMAQSCSLLICGNAGEALGDSIYETVIYMIGKPKSLGADCIEKKI